MDLSTVLLAVLSSLILSPWLCIRSGPGVRAQNTNATCSPDYDWANNSKGYSPCLVAAYVSSECETKAAGTFIPALPDDSPPHAYDQGNTTCQCSTAFYSLISACTHCQPGHNPMFWSAYTEDCPSVIISMPGSLSVGTDIPSWAFLDVTAADTYNATLAREEAAKAPPPTDIDGEATAPPSPTDTPASTSTDNKGAIIGGVVGGVLFLVLTTLVICFLLRRHRRTRGQPRQPRPTLIRGEDEHASDDRVTMYSNTVSMIKSGSTSPSPPSHSRINSNETAAGLTLNSIAGGTHGHSHHHNRSTSSEMISRMIGSPVSTRPTRRTADNPTGFTGAAEI